VEARLVCWERGRLVRTEREARKDYVSVLRTLCGRDVRVPCDYECDAVRDLLSLSVFRVEIIPLSQNSHVMAHMSRHDKGERAH
jgi:hypothetical protein